ncbi:hypothetical protein V6O07_23620 [Arthrospira platensis SPKY2]
MNNNINYYNNNLSEYHIPIKIYYDKEDNKLKIDIEYKIEICEVKVDIDKEGIKELDNKIEEILKDEDKSLTLIAGIDENGDILIYDTSVRSTNIFEVEIEREVIQEYNGDNLELSRYIKDKIKNNFLELDSKLVIPNIKI